MWCSRGFHALQSGFACARLCLLKDDLKYQDCRRAWVKDVIQQIILLLLQAEQLHAEVVQLPALVSVANLV